MKYGIYFGENDKLWESQSFHGYVDQEEFEHFVKLNQYSIYHSKYEAEKNALIVYFKRV